MKAMPDFTVRCEQHREKPQACPECARLTRERIAAYVDRTKPPKPKAPPFFLEQVRASARPYAEAVLYYHWANGLGFPMYGLPTIGRPDPDVLRFMAARGYRGRCVRRGRYPEVYPMGYHPDVSYFVWEHQLTDDERRAAEVADATGKTITAYRGTA